MKSRRPARRRNLRLAQAVLAQRSRSLRFQPPASTRPRLSLVTGGNKGIGAAVASRLGDDGCAVVVAARAVADDLPPSLDRSAGQVSMRLDLADLDQVHEATDRLVSSLGDRRLDVVVLNAGMAPSRLSRSAQGHELAFAVNVLGHYLLLERLRRANALAEGARVVVVTGDILMVARNCSPDYTSEHPRAGAMAYARSKLGNLWLAREVARRHPGLHVVAVHPGVVRSGLGGPSEPRLWHRLTQISPARSSETVLAAAFADEVPSGAYVHNTLGLVSLDERDVAADRERGAAFVTMLDELAAPWLQRPTAHADPATSASEVDTIPGS